MTQLYRQFCLNAEMYGSPNTANEVLMAELQVQILVALLDSLFLHERVDWSYHVSYLQVLQFNLSSTKSFDVNINE